MLIKYDALVRKNAGTTGNLSEAIEERGIQKGIQEETLRSIHALMKNAHLSSKEAMGLLKIPESDRSKYLELLQQSQ